MLGVLSLTPDVSDASGGEASHAACAVSISPSTIAWASALTLAVPFTLLLQCKW